uniref:Uncharacterized protein n=1 Tax=Klebsiella pneumoniae TaxID=573 RepID=A0A2R4NEF5_KLEPN|nr:hypothetical protein [Klebsiella pneumoniae]
MPALWRSDDNPGTLTRAAPLRAAFFCRQKCHQQASLRIFTTCSSVPFLFPAQGVMPGSDDILTGQTAKEKGVIPC